MHHMSQLIPMLMSMSMQKTMNTSRSNLMINTSTIIKVTQSIQLSTKLSLSIQSILISTTMLSTHNQL